MSRPKPPDHKPAPAPATAITPKVRPTVGTILDQLDAADDSRFRNRRSADRVRLRRLAVPVRVFHPGGSISDRMVSTRNLSGSGIGFLYDRFLHLGTRVIFMLPQRLGGADAIEGTVVYCAHVAGAFHQVGARFEKKIFPSLYLDGHASDVVSPVDRDDSAKRLTPRAPLSGRLLLIDADAMDRALVAHHLRDTQLELTIVADLDAACDVLGQPDASFGVVMIELDPTDDQANSTLSMLRGCGHDGILCAALSAKITAEHRAAARAIGVAGIVSKPYSRSELLATLEALFNPAAANSIDPLTVLTRTVDEVQKIASLCNTAKPQS